MSVGRTKVVAYAFMGLFCALGGLSLTASTGIGTPVPGPYTLFSVAAIVLGGVSLAGGVGGLFGPIVAVIILSLIRTDMTFLNVNTNLAVVAQGVILIGGRHVRQRHPDAAGTVVSAPVRSGAAMNRWLTLAAWRQLFRERPIVPLTGLLAVLVGLTRARPTWDREPGLGRGRGPSFNSARHPRRLPDDRDADRGHRPVGRRGGLDVRVPRLDPRQRARRRGRHRRRPGRGRPGRTRHGPRRRSLPGPSADHDARR